MLSELENGIKCIGVKQSKKAIKDGHVRRIFIAEDAESRVKQPIEDMCREKGLVPVSVPTMRELGDACGIDVGAAVAVLLK